MDERGVVFESDLGEDTERTACEARQFDPTADWKISLD